MNFLRKPIFAVFYLPVAYLVAFFYALYLATFHFADVFKHTVKHGHRVYGRMMRKPVPKTKEQDDFWNFS